MGFIKQIIISAFLFFLLSFSSLGMAFNSVIIYQVLVNGKTVFQSEQLIETWILATLLELVISSVFCAALFHWLYQSKTTSKYSYKNRVNGDKRWTTKLTESK